MIKTLNPVHMCSDIVLCCSGNTVSYSQLRKESSYFPYCFLLSYHSKVLWMPYMAFNSQVDGPGMLKECVGTSSSIATTSDISYPLLSRLWSSQVMPKALFSTQRECVSHLSAKHFKSSSSIQIAYFFPFYFSTLIK